MTISKRVWIASGIGLAVVVIPPCLRLTTPIVSWLGLSWTRVDWFNAKHFWSGQGSHLLHRVSQTLTLPASFRMATQWSLRQPQIVQERDIEIVPTTNLTPASLQETSIGGQQTESRAGMQSQDCQVSSVSDAYQIRFKGQVVAMTGTKVQAQIWQEQLGQVMNAPDFDPAQIRPVMQPSGPAIAVGGLILPTDMALAQRWNCHAELLTIHWMNNLYRGLGQPEMSLPVAQEMLHALQTTNRKLAGIASWYGDDFHGLPTATGETYDAEAFTAAHPSLPFDTFLRVTNLNNGRAVVVRINDRGPYYGNRSLDMSRAAARSLGSEQIGVVPFEATILQSTTSNSDQDLTNL